jgi:hypothetical protein
MGTVHEDICTVVIISHHNLLKIRDVSDKGCRESQNTHFMFSNVFQKIVLLNNVEKCGITRQATDDNIIGCMHFACWVTKARDTHT